MQNDEGENVQGMESTVQGLRHILLINASSKRKVVSLEASTYFIGRDPDNSIYIDSKWVSRQHAILLRVTAPNTINYAFRVVDGDLRGNRSTNGLWVNGKRCFSHDLRHGDEIIFAKEVTAKYYVAPELSDEEIIQHYEAGDAFVDSSERIDPFQTLAEFSPKSENIGETSVIRLASFPELLPSPIIEVDFAGEITYINPSASKRFPDLQEKGSKHPLVFDLLLVRDKTTERCCSRQIKIGSQVFEQCIHYIHENDLIRSYIFDITERVQTEEALQRSEAKNRALLNAIPDLMMQINHEGLILDYKPAKGFNLPETPEVLIHKNIRDIFSPAVAQQMMHHLRHVVGTGEAQIFEYEISSKEQFFCYEVRLVLSTENEVLAIVRNITEQKFFEKQLIHDALHDPLTKLPNRHLFMNRLAHVLALSKRREDYLFAVLFVDLDRFKFINDSFGHIIGDQLLVSISRRLEICLRDGDTVARLGGDEFAVLLEDLKSLKDANQVADRILQELSQPFNLDQHEVFMTASIGIAWGMTSYERPEELLRDADTAMYHAKSLGKARYEIFDTAMHSRVVALLQLDSDLRRAIERQEFCLHYQPIVSLKSGRIIGFETLIRWQHPERGMVPPAEFIAIAEETGLIIPMGEWILYEACHQAHQWQIQYPSDPPLSVNVNLSGKQFTQPHLADQIAKILHRTSLDSRSLKLEITESAVMENNALATKTLANLKALNVDLCIDDFGTGYSSLSYLHRFPIDILKVDRSFISTMDRADESSRYEITRAIITLAHNLGISVVAEGVETIDQLEKLRSLQCEFGQGYFFSPPVDAKTASGLIEKQPQW